MNDQENDENQKSKCFWQIISRIKKIIQKRKAVRYHRRRERKEKKADKRSTKMILQKTAIPRSIKVVNAVKVQNSLNDSFSLGSWNTIIHPRHKEKQDSVSSIQITQRKPKRLSSITVATQDCVALKDEIEDVEVKLSDEEKIESTLTESNPAQEQHFVSPTTTTITTGRSPVAQWAKVKRNQSLPSFENSFRVFEVCNHASRLPILALTEYYRHLSMPRIFFSTSVADQVDDSWSIPAATINTDKSKSKQDSGNSAITLASF